MKIVSGAAGLEQPLADLFTATFTASEGPAEGAAIGGLVKRLLAETPAPDLRVFTGFEDDRPVGAVAFSRLAFTDDPRAVFLLSPMAVAPDRQGQGLGQALIREGLRALANEGVEIVITYGDPNFYGRVGFHPIDPATVPPPLPLSHPHGWIGQSLTAAPIPALPGPSRCVAALNDPSFW